MAPDAPLVHQRLGVRLGRPPGRCRRARAPACRRRPRPSSAPSIASMISSACWTRLRAEERRRCRRPPGRRPGPGTAGRRRRASAGIAGPSARRRRPTSVSQEAERASGEPTGRATSRSIPAAQPRLASVRAAGRASAGRRARGAPAAAGAGRCRWSLATPRTRRRRRSRRGRRAGVAAGRASPRRVGGFADRAFDAGRRRDPAGALGEAVDRPPERRQGDDRWRAPYRPGRMSSVIPASRTTWRPAALADVEDARRPASRPGRRAPGRVRSRGGSGGGRRGSASSRAGQLAREPRRAWVPARRAGQTGNPPPTSSVSNVVDRCRATARPAPAPCGRRRARHRPRRAATRRGGGCPRGRSGPSGPPPASMAAAISVSVMPNLAAPRPDGEAGERLGRDVRVEPVEDVERRRAGAGRARSASAAASSGDSMAIQRSGCPSAAAADRGPQVGVGLADALERDPVVRDAGRGRRAHSPRDTTFAPKPRGGDRGDDRRDVVGLDRELRGATGRGRRRATSRPPPASVARSVTRRRRPNRRPRGRASARGASTRSGVVRRRGAVLDDQPDDRRDDADDDRADERGDERVGGESPAGSRRP